VERKSQRKDKEKDEERCLPSSIVYTNTALNGK
jgi:hypothetical protein